jgi:hypothetical protein
MVCSNLRLARKAYFVILEKFNLLRGSGPTQVDRLIQGLDYSALPIALTVYEIVLASAPARATAAASATVA